MRKKGCNIIEHRSSCSCSKAGKESLLYFGCWQPGSGVGCGELDVSSKADFHPTSTPKNQEQEILYREGRGYMQKQHSQL